ncbi:hypothetical protein RJ639_037304 [Escallonia herrerae]|uniref:Uncharacterized protein n=1 Tax=Escallonia herrerae TaxID=1293975 RepID=A0AA89BHY7_9ASTE|nr:hypothetical protein RJ639_037304 [Escallonia herrerae]
MASNQNVRDIQWVLVAIKSESCHQETENFLNISISKDTLVKFSHLLTVLATTKNTQLSLQNSEFHQFQWELQQVRNLGIFLESNSNVKELVFRKNRFNVECLSEISEILKKNGVIKEIMLSESGIGSMGAGLLASALKLNSSLEELQIWEDSIGGAVKVIEANSTLKLLTIFGSNSITATPLISAVLGRNRSMEVHVWSGEHEKKSSKVVSNLRKGHYEYTALMSLVLAELLVLWDELNSKVA